MRIAIVGCGFVADLYAGTLPAHPELSLVGATDRDPGRAQTFCTRHGGTAYASLDALLSDRRVEVVVNLTNPESHYEVTRAALEAGKHVYSEKPLALTMKDAAELGDLAKRNGVSLSAAPCSLLSTSAQTMCHALRSNRIGQVHLVYAELDDGMVHKMPYERWRSSSGLPWPYRSEFENGCTLEHAGYTVSWLAAFFGPARSITAFNACQVTDKRPGEAMASAPDFSVACIVFASGVVARLTCSILAPRDHSIRIFGEHGVLSTPDNWLNDGPVHVQRWLTLGRRTFLNPIKRRCPPVRLPHPRVRRRGASQMDYLLGVQELCDAVREHRPSRLSADFCLHTNEIVLAIHNAGATGAPYRPTTTFDPSSVLHYPARDDRRQELRRQPA